MLGVRLGLLLGFVAALPARGCDSSFTCTEHVDVRRNFTVEIRFEGMPVGGATVTMRRGQSAQTFTTGTDGKAVTAPLPAGDYSLDVEKFRISIAYVCSVRVSRIGRGKRELTYTMDEKPWPVAKMSGRLTEWQWENNMFRVIRRPPKKEVPSAGKDMTLHAFAGPDRHVTVAEDGSFDFGEVPEGLYALQVSGDGFHPRLFRLETGAKHREMNLMWEDGICGSKFVSFRDEVKE